MVTPMFVEKNGILIGKMKPEQVQDKSDNNGSETNFKAICYILNGASPNKFHKIVTCKYASSWKL